MQNEIAQLDFTSRLAFKFNTLTAVLLTKFSNLHNSIAEKLQPTFSPLKHSPAHSPKSISIKIKREFNTLRLENVVGVGRIFSAFQRLFIQAESTYIRRDFNYNSETYGAIYVK